MQTRGRTKARTMYGPRKPSSKSKTRTTAKRSQVVISPSIGLGMSATTVLRTSFFANVAAVGATGIFNGFLKPGSCFDPAGDMGAMQPVLFDQWASMYARYKVNSALIRLKITGSQGAGNATAWVGCMYPSVFSTALATYQGAASQAYAKTTSGGFQTLALAAGFAPGAEGKTLTLKYNENAVIGVKGADAFDSGALMGADPTALQYSVVPLFLQCNQVGGSTWTVEIDMWQNVTFSQKNAVVDA